MPSKDWPGSDDTRNLAPLGEGAGEGLFLVGVQPFVTTLFGVPIPLPTPQGRRALQLKTRPECWIRGLHEASTQGVEAASANLFRKECLGMQRSPKAMQLRLSNIDLPECDCHLPTMESAGRWSRPVTVRIAREAGGAPRKHLQAVGEAWRSRKRKLSPPLPTEGRAL